jgi:hypothetical protein
MISSNSGDYQPEGYSDQASSPPSASMEHTEQQSESSQEDYYQLPYYAVPHLKWETMQLATTTTGNRSHEDSDLEATSSLREAILSQVERLPLRLSSQLSYDGIDPPRTQQTSPHATIPFPPTVLQLLETATRGGDDTRERKPGTKPSDDRVSRLFRLSDFQIDPNEHYRDGVSRGSDKRDEKKRLLSPDQFHQLYSTGQVTVPNPYFQNREDTWQISRWLFSGAATNWQNLLRNDIGNVCISHIAVYLPDAIGGNRSAPDNGVGDPTGVSFHKESVTAKPPSSFWDWNLRDAWKNGFRVAIEQIVHALFDQVINCWPMPYRRPKYAHNLHDIILPELEQGYVEYHLRQSERNHEQQHTQRGAADAGRVEFDSGEEKQTDQGDNLGTQSQLDYRYAYRTRVALDRSDHGELQSYRESVLKNLWEDLGRQNCTSTDPPPPTTDQLRAKSTDLPLIQKQVMSPRGVPALPAGCFYKRDGDVVNDELLVIRQIRSVYHEFLHRWRYHIEKALDKPLTTHDTGCQQERENGAPTVIEQMREDEKQQALAQSKARSQAWKQVMHQLARGVGSSLNDSVKCDVSSSFGKSVKPGFSFNFHRVDISQDVAAMEVARICARESEEAIEANDEIKMQGDRAEFESDVRKRNPTLSLSDVWYHRQVRRWELKKRESLRSTRLSRVGAHLKHLGHSEMAHVYFRRHDFQTKARPVVIQHLSRYHEQLDPVDVVIPNFNGIIGDGVHSHADRPIHVYMDRPFRRWYVWWLSAVQLSIWLVGTSACFLWSGPLSLRALVAKDPYFVSGPRGSGGRPLTMTLRSRLLAFRKSIHESKARFETEPDNGLLAKDTVRLFVASYLRVKLMIGMFLISSFMVCGTFFAIVASTMTLVFSPVLGTAAATAGLTFRLIVYDYLTHEMSPAFRLLFVVPFKIIFPGLGQAALALGRMVVFHPVVGVTALTAGLVKWILRSLRDSCTWITLIRRHARLPKVNTFVARRVAGPGISSTYFYRLPIGAAKAAVSCLLDVVRLEAHSALRAAELNLPFQEYQRLFENITQPFGVITRMQHPSPANLACTLEFDNVLCDNHSSFPISETTGASTSDDVWERVSSLIRDGHPEARGERMRELESDFASCSLESFGAMDDRIARIVEARSEKYLAYLTDRGSWPDKGSPVLADVLKNVALTLAKWNMQALARSKLFAPASSCRYCRCCSRCFLTPLCVRRKTSCSSNSAATDSSREVSDDKA